LGGDSNHMRAPDSEFERKLKWLNLASICGLVAICFLVVACKPRGPPNPPGRITINYDGLRNDGMSVSDVFFIMENRSTRTIYFRGTKTFWSGTIPVYAGMDCTNTNSSTSYSSSFPLVDFIGSPPPYVKVSPGVLLRLNVGGDYGSFVAQNSGNLCRLQLQLMADEVIESTSFRPVVTF
jgi:hypothetical protein